MADPQVNPAINRIAARLEPSLRRAFERAVTWLQQTVTLDAIVEAVTTGGVTPQILAALADFPAHLAPIGRLIQQTYTQAATSAAGHLANLLNTDVAFNLTNPRAVAWAATRTGTLITEVQQTTVQAVRAVIARSFTEGIPPREAARLIRPLVGLTDTQSQAVINYRFQLLEDGRTAEDVARLAERYAAKLERQRALLIARTETIDSANAGQQELWQQAVEDGYLDLEDTRRRWLAADDERTCPVCGDGLDDVEATLTEPFYSRIDQLPFDRPPAHPACRCSVGLSAA